MYAFRFFSLSSAWPDPHHLSPPPSSRENPYLSIDRFWPSISISQCLFNQNKYMCIKWPDIKPHKIRSVAFRSRCTMIILDKSFIHQLDLNSFYSILYMSEIKPTRNDTCAPWSSVVWCSRLQNATAKSIVSMFSDTVTLWVHSSNDKSNLAPDYERYSRLWAPPRSIRYYINQFYARLNVFNIQRFLLSEKCPG
jgi:hypothetical protein